MMGGFSISLFGSLATSVRLFSAPLSLIFISANLTTEEIAFYFTFSSVIAAQQMAELGLGHVIKQHIAHVFKVVDSEWSPLSKIKVKEYLYFGIKWFFIISLFIALIVGPAGYIYFSSYVGNVNWQAPWLVLVGVTALANMLTPYILTLDATQNQRLVYKSQILSAAVNAVCIWLFVCIDMRLYSLALALILSGLSQYIYIRKYIHQVNENISLETGNLSFIKTFSELWPLTSKVSVVWGVGFLFWNGFNIIAFKIYEASYAGRVILTITIVRAIYSVCDAVFSSQMTYFSNLIANDKAKDVLSLASRYRAYSISVYFVLILLLFLFEAYGAHLPVFDKVVYGDCLISSSIFFFILLIVTTNNNMIRCFKVEPFVVVSLINGLVVPFVFFVCNSFGFRLLLYPCAVVLFVSLCFSLRISHGFIKSYMADKS
jgi:hypothetical protein